ncbi:alpha/beta fold hydrolase [Catellatospora methionotrophica]|uniref:alpha/beta fold hydrolase n=1 Tax=Catellatospora methionotrophica TaxID=121620 RepID=UPI0033D95978
MIKTVRSGAVDIAYEQFGRPGDEPLLLVMGLSFQMIWWPEEFCEQLAERGFHVVRFDNRDSGLSSRCPGTKYAARDLAADALAVMDALGWDSAHVAGASLGSAIAQLVAITAPQRVRSLTCIMSGGVGGNWNTLRVLKFGVLAKLAGKRYPPDLEGRTQAQVDVIRAMSSPHRPFEQDRIRRIAAVGAERGGLDNAATQRQFAAGRTTGNLTRQLRQVRMPALIVHGEDDPLIRPVASRDIAAAIPGSRLLVYPQMGHEIPSHLFTVLADEIRSTAAAALGS